MFDYLARKKILMALPLAVLFTLLIGCKEEETANVPESEPIDLSKIEDLFSEPLKPNPLTTDPDIVVVRVNGEEITRGDILKRTESAMQQLSGRIQPQQIPQIRRQLHEQFKNELINQKLIDAAVAEAPVQVSEEEILQTIEQVKSRIPKGQTFEESLAAQDTTLEELTQNIRQNIKTSKFLESKITDVAEATETEANEFYDKNLEKFKKPERVTASHILIKVEETDTEEAKNEKKEAIENIRKKIIADTVTFDEAAKKHSGCPSSAQGGSLPPFEKGQMVPEFEAAAFSQEIGEVGDIVETRFGYHIIKVSGYDEAGTVIFDEAKEQILTHLGNQKKQQKLQQYIQRLRDSASIENITL